jgi:hypothetical protein
MVEDIILAVVSAAIYSIIFFVKKREGDSNEEFDYFKLGATLIVGLAVGLSIYLSGLDLTQVRFEERILMYTGTIALVESILKTLVRRFRKMRNSNGFTAG